MNNIAEITPFEGVYLKTYLKPFAHWLDQGDVTEILVNRPGEAWIERSGRPDMERVEIAELTDDLLSRLAGQVARTTHQGVNRENPLLAATLPGGERIQMVEFSGAEAISSAALGSTGLGSSAGLGSNVIAAPIPRKLEAGE